MATKKTTPRRQIAKAKTTRERAARIVANAKRYNAGTRAAISRALDEGHADLAECVKRAERGETILDISGATASVPTMRPEDEAALSELQNFARHLAEALRIARHSPMIPASLYNGLSDALTDFENDLPNLTRLCESESHIILTLNAFIEQTAAQAEKKGGQR
jgi:hypothetical protein